MLPGAGTAVPGRVDLVSITDSKNAAHSALPDYGEEECSVYPIKGMYYYQEEIELLGWGDLGWCWAELVPEPDNPLDNWAIKVEIYGMRVGYIDAVSADEFQWVIRCYNNRGYRVYTLCFIEDVDSGYIVLPTDSKRAELFGYEECKEVIRNIYRCVPIEDAEAELPLKGRHPSQALVEGLWDFKYKAPDLFPQEPKAEDFCWLWDEVYNTEIAAEWWKRRNRRIVMGVAELAENGISKDVCADMLGVPEDDIDRAFRTLRIAPPLWSLKPLIKNLKCVVALYCYGYSVPQIRDFLDLESTTVKRIIEESGLRIRDEEEQRAKNAELAARDDGSFVTRLLDIRKLENTEFAEQWRKLVWDYRINVPVLLRLRRLRHPEEMRYELRYYRSLEPRLDLPRQIKPLVPPAPRGAASRSAQPTPAAEPAPEPLRFSQVTVEQPEHGVDKLPLGAADPGPPVVEERPAKRGQPSSRRTEQAEQPATQRGSGEEIQLTTEFQHALELMRAGENVLLSGKAGTGKSTLLRMYLEQQAADQVLVTAPTGVAALNVQGFTIHRAFGFRPGMVPADIERGGKWRPQQALRAADVLVVDEISMVRADLFDMMDIALRRVRDSELPFGGIQLILVGDLLQLPPVVPAIESQSFSSQWSSPYFFSAHCYSKLHLTPVNLTTVWRQSDPAFLEVLNEVREGSVSEGALELLNGLVDPDFQAPPGWVTLASRRATVDQINRRHLNALSTQKFLSQAIFTGSADAKAFGGTEELRYAVGARVMTVVNDSWGRFVNGSFGTLVGATSESVSVKLDHSGEIVNLGKHTWEINAPGVEGGVLRSTTVGTVEQFPIILAWALTVHKAQGKTLPKLFIDMTGGMSTDGQFYVALSRAVDLEHLRFSNVIEHRHIRANNTLVRMIRREVAPTVATDRVAFLSFDGPSFDISDHIARAHAVVVESGEIVADFGTWLNPMSDLGEFGKRHQIPRGGLVLSPTLGDFWPLLLRQVAGSLVVADGLPKLERAVRHQEKGLDLSLGMGFDVSELEFDPLGTDVVQRARSMAQAYLDHSLTLGKGEPAPDAPRGTEGSVYLPPWSPPLPMLLDPRRATASDNAWAAFSHGPTKNLDPEEVKETAEILAAWAISRGAWTDEVREEVLRRARWAGLYQVDLPEVEVSTVDIPSLFRPGSRVAFTGRRNLLGEPADDARLAEICSARGLVYKSGVSRTGCDVLVAFDPTSMSTKAKAAREFGIPIVAQEDFEHWYNSGAPRVEVPSRIFSVEAAYQEPEVLRVDDVEDSPVPQDIAAAQSKHRLTWVHPEEFFAKGTRVAFRGSTYINGELYPQGPDLQELCDQLGLEYKKAVTKTRCDVLVTDDPEARDGKMNLARYYDKPVMLQSEFRDWATDQLAKLEDPDDEPAAPDAPVEEPDTWWEVDDEPAAPDAPVEEPDTWWEVDDEPTPEPVYEPSPLPGEDFSSQPLFAGKAGNSAQQPLFPDKAEKKDNQWWGLTLRRVVKALRRK